MGNIATGRERCDRLCPKGNFAFKDYGDLVQCEHGALFMVRVRFISWPRRYDRNNFQRLSPFWTPILWRRARKQHREIIEGENDD